MAFVNLKEILKDAKENNYAIGAFNVENMEMILSVIKGASQMKAPVIIQTTPSTLKYAPSNVISSMVRTLAEEGKIPVCLHLDHSNSFELCSNAINNGYSSVMIDASKLPLEENIILTNKVINFASRHNVSVEAELGKVGGKEDNINVDKKEALLTNIEDAIIFTKKTNLDALAIAIGTSHGFYKGEPILDFERLKKIKENIDTPLVLHGASGLKKEDITKSVSLGINKVNFATELRSAYTIAVRKILEDKDVYDPKIYGREAIYEVSNLVMEKISLLS